MNTVVRHPNGVMVNGKLYYRDAYYAAGHISLREWLALVTLVTGLLVWAGLLLGGVGWLIYEVLHRWR